MTVSPPEDEPAPRPHDDVAEDETKEGEDVAGHLFTGALRDLPPG